MSFSRERKELRENFDKEAKAMKRQIEILQVRTKGLPKAHSIRTEHLFYARNCVLVGLEIVSIVFAASRENQCVCAGADGRLLATRCHSSPATGCSNSNPGRVKAEPERLRRPDLEAGILSSGNAPDLTDCALNEPQFFHLSHALRFTGTHQTQQSQRSFTLTILREPHSCHRLYTRSASHSSKRCNRRINLQHLVLQCNPCCLPYGTVTILSCLVRSS